MEVDRLSIPYEYFSKMEKKTRHNDEIADFYRQLFEETEDFVFDSRAKSVDLCTKYIDVDYYRLQGVKNIKRINHCKDRFCPHCQSLFAQKREMKFSPVLDGFAEDFDLYHVVFTVPNCSGEDLKKTVDLMYKKFGYMMRYFKGDAKVAGVDFVQYGYAGGLRSLEITQNFKDMTFHPHFHCVMLLRKGLQLEKTQINEYSFDGRKLSRKFSELEILMQKIWYLLMNGQQVNKRAIEELPQGYSVIADPAEQGKYHQIFKYAIKGCFKGDQLYDYNTFKTLYYALHSRRILQGYGVLHNYDFEEDEILDEETDEQYDALLQRLEYIEKPVFVAEGLNEVLCESLKGNVRYISKANFKKLLAETYGEEMFESNKKTDSGGKQWARSKRRTKEKPAKSVNFAQMPPPPKWHNQPLT